MDKPLDKPHVAAGVIIRKDGKYLLVQEKKATAYGLWNLPAGRVQEGEEIEAAAVREAKEETGFDVRLKSQIGIHELQPGFRKYTFEAEIVGGTLRFPQDEILDARWFTLDEILALNAENKIRVGWATWAIHILESK